MEPEERRIALTEMLRSTGWAVAREALADQLDMARRQLETTAPEDVPAIAARQAEIRLLRHIVEEPQKHLWLESKKGAR